MYLCAIATIYVACQVPVAEVNFGEAKRLRGAVSASLVALRFERGNAGNANVLSYRQVGMN